MSISPGHGTALQRKQETSSLADVVSTILDKGIVIDLFARVSLVGIELVRVDARVVVASVDTYLRFAEAANRLELGTQEPDQVSDVLGGVVEKGGERIAERKAKDKVGKFLSSGKN
jgi:gas vesicle structural protein